MSPTSFMRDATDQSQGVLEQGQTDSFGSDAAVLFEPFSPVFIRSSRSVFRPLPNTRPFP